MRTVPTRWELALLALFGAVVASFLSATAYSQHRASAIDERARQIADEVSPAIERLAAVRADVRRLQALVTTYARAPANEMPVAFERVQAGRQALNEDIQQYVRLRHHGSDRELWNQLIDPKLDELKYAARRVVEEVQSGAKMDARGDATRELTVAADEVGAALLRGQDLNASIAHDLAVRIEQTRERSAAIGWLLDLLCTLTTVVAALLVVRIHRRHTALIRDHAQLLESRNQSLEEFAGRVAHDILSPLSSVSMALGTLESAKGTMPDRPALSALIARGSRSLRKVQLVVNDLLEFARAGAQPVGSARAFVRTVVEDVVDSLAPAAERNSISVETQPLGSCAVACSPGVLTSLVSNLVENAIKYMHDCPVRHVTIRAIERGQMVMIEVEDTGPGIPTELAPKVFSPYVRGASNKQPGIGLGLATVKRMAEAHGGAVGVDTALGRGSKFWFELPRASKESLDAVSCGNEVLAGPTDATH